MTTLAPSFPSTPGSRGFGLRARPPLRLRKPSMPVGFCPFPATPLTPSAGRVALLSASSDHDPVSPSTTCIPPPFDAFRVPPRARVWVVPAVWIGGGSLVSLVDVAGGKYSELDEVGKSGTGELRDRWSGGEPFGVCAVDCGDTTSSSAL